ncbi:hypothetical protein A7Q09_05405 [Methylacidiphilum sp. Yel]|uniref:hypothetical protein n=1 Tax=Methylacidiphilum sp. Yel TaxID=1847730 RepID=UPI0011028356|nr:hypothetical protein [Methylacidiphilum sp. Yel]TFE69329.1 hypothetical protein A7Q09_05405 [Methylacidiphilum sp. Yel]
MSALPSLAPHIRAGIFPCDLLGLQRPDSHPPDRRIRLLLTGKQVLVPCSPEEGEGVPQESLRPIPAIGTGGYICSIFPPYPIVQAVPPVSNQAQSKPPGKSSPLFRSILLLQTAKATEKDLGLPWKKERGWL